MRKKLDIKQQRQASHKSRWNSKGVLTDRDVDTTAFEWWVSVDTGTKGHIHELLVWEFSLLSAAPKGLKFRALLSPTKTTGALKLVPFGAEGAQRNTDKPQPNLLLSSLLFGCSLGTGTICIEVRTKPNSSGVKWKSSRLFPRCTVPFVQAGDLGEGAQDIMTVSLGKHTQTMVCVWKGEQINQDQAISHLLFLKKDSITSKQSTHKNNT